MPTNRNLFLNSTQLGCLLFNVKKLPSLPIFEIYTYMLPHHTTQLVDPECDGLSVILKYCLCLTLVSSFIDTSLTSLPIEVSLCVHTKTYAELLCMFRRFMVKVITVDRDYNRIDVTGYGLRRFTNYGYKVLAHLHKIIPRMPTVIFNCLFTPFYQINTNLQTNRMFGYGLLIFGKNTADIIEAIKHSNKSVNISYLIRQFCGQMLFAMSLIVCDIFYGREMTVDNAEELELKVESFCLFMNAFLTVFCVGASFNETLGDTPRSIACERGHRMSTFVHTYIKASIEIFFCLYEILSLEYDYVYDLKQLVEFFMQIGSDMRQFTQPSNNILKSSFKWNNLYNTLMSWYKPDSVRRTITTRNLEYSARELLSSYLKDLTRLKRLEFGFSSNLLDYEYHY